MKKTQLISLIFLCGILVQFLPQVRATTLETNDEMTLEFSQELTDQNWFGQMVTSGTYTLPFHPRIANDELADYNTFVNITNVQKQTNTLSDSASIASDYVDSQVETMNLDEYSIGAGLDSLITLNSSQLMKGNLNFEQVESESYHPAKGWDLIKIMIGDEVDGAEIWTQLSSSYYSIHSDTIVITGGFKSYLKIIFSLSTTSDSLLISDSSTKAGSQSFTIHKSNAAGSLGNYVTQTIGTFAEHSSSNLNSYMTLFYTTGLSRVEVQIQKYTLNIHEFEYSDYLINNVEQIYVQVDAYGGSKSYTTAQPTLDSIGRGIESTPIIELPYISNTAEHYIFGGVMNTTLNSFYVRLETVFISDLTITLYRNIFNIAPIDVTLSYTYNSIMHTITKSCSKYNLEFWKDGAENIYQKYSISVDSSSFIEYYTSKLDNCYIPSQSIQIDFNSIDVVNFDLTLDYATTEWIVPSEVALKINNEAIIDSTYNSGWVILNSYSNKLIITASSPVLFNITLISYFGYQFELDKSTTSYLYSNLQLDSEFDLTLIEYIYNAEFLRMYINMHDYGANTIGIISLKLIPDAYIRFRVILNRNYVDELIPASYQNVTFAQNYTGLSNGSQITLESPQYPCTTHLNVTSAQGFVQEEYIQAQNSTTVLQDSISSEENAIPGDFYAVDSFDGKSSTDYNWCAWSPTSHANSEIIDYGGHLSVLHFKKDLYDSISIRTEPYSFTSDVVVEWYLRVDEQISYYLPGVISLTQDNVTTPRIRCGMYRGSTNGWYLSTDSDSIVYTSPWSTGNWYHMQLLIGTDKSVKLYVNGTYVTSRTATISTINYLSVDQGKPGVNSYVDAIGWSWSINPIYSAGDNLNLDVTNIINYTVTYPISTNYRTLTIANILECSEVLDVEFLSIDNNYLNEYEFLSINNTFYLGKYSVLYLNESNYLNLLITATNKDAFIINYTIDILTSTENQVTFFNVTTIPESQIQLQNPINLTLLGPTTIQLLLNTTSWIDLTVTYTYQIADYISQLDSAITTDSTNVNVRYAFETEIDFTQYVARIAGTCSKVQLSDGTQLNWTQSGSEIYIIADLENGTLILIDSIVDPEFSVVATQLTTNGTSGSYRFSITADDLLRWENVTIVTTLTEFWNNWSTGTQSENREYTRFIIAINVQLTFIDYCTRDVPIAEFATFENEDIVIVDGLETITYSANLNFTVYSELWQLDIPDSWTLDGVHYQQRSYDVSSTGLFSCEGFGTSITTAELQFTTQSIQSYESTQYSNRIEIVINSTLPIDGWVEFEIRDVRSYQMEDSNVILWVAGNDVDTYRLPIAIKAGVTTINVYFTQYSITDQIWLLLPVLGVCVIYMVYQQYKKGNLTRENIKKFFKRNKPEDKR